MQLADFCQIIRMSTAYLHAALQKKNIHISSAKTTQFLSECVNERFV